MNHEGREGHEGSYKPFSMRIPSPLTPEAELAMTETIGCGIAVHRALGPGFLESIFIRRRCILNSTHVVSRTNPKSRSPFRTVAFKSKGNELIWLSKG